jgi:hypothetical protein
MNKSLIKESIAKKSEVNDLKRKKIEKNDSKTDSKKKIEVITIEDSPKHKSTPKPKSKPIPKSLPKPMTKPMSEPLPKGLKSVKKVRIGEQKETRTISFFQKISDPDYLMGTDSAGHKFDETLFIRNLHRKSILDALKNGNIPLGANNPIATAHRIEGKIFNELKYDLKSYRHQCLMSAAYLNDEENREIRLNVLMGRIDPEDFAFMATEDMELNKMVALRIAWKVRERQRLSKLG